MGSGIDEAGFHEQEDIHILTYLHSVTMVLSIIK